MIACGVWSLVRMSLLVSVLLSLTVFPTNNFVVNRKLLILSREDISALHECRSLSTTLPNNGLTVFSIQEPTITYL